jgi:hypothetical protein
MPIALQVRRTPHDLPARTGLLQRAGARRATAQAEKCAANHSPGAAVRAAGEARFEQGFSQVPARRQSEAQTGPAGQAQAAQPGVPPVVRQVLAQRGRPLEPGVRTFMEARFGYDFSRVQVHVDAQAAESARAVNALAYTAGQKVVFGAGQYAPGIGAGQKLLAHELAHVVQQETLGTPPPQAFQLGLPDDPLERQAERAASLASGAPPADLAHAPRPLVQRQPIVQAEGAGSGLGLGLPTLGLVNLPSESAVLEAGETLSAQNPKLIRLAQAFQSLQATSPGAHIELSANLSQAAQMSSARAAEERRSLSGRLAAARDALQSLGVPRDQLDIRPPTAFATSARGQISVDLFKARQPLIVPPSTQPAPGQGTQPQPQPAPGLPNLGDLLTLKFGPLTIELPKSVALKLPIPISTAKKLVIDLQAEASGSFSFSITLDGLRYVRVALKAGAAYDKEKGVTGSAGLQIEMTRTVCSAANPEGLKAKINKAGEDLKKAMQEYSAEPDSDKKLLKLADIGGALGEMYDAVDKAKSACKQVPAATFDFGVKGPLGGGTDPNKPEPSYLGGTITIPF